MLDSQVYREALRVSSPDPVPEWIVPYSFLQASELERIVAYLKVGAGSVVVDLGCGLGGAALWVAERTGASVTGVDFASAAIERARGRVVERGTQARIEYTIADMTQTGLGSNSVDGIMSVDALMFADARGVCNEIARVLRDGGRAALFAVEPQNPPHGTCAVSDYRPYFEGAGLRIDEHAPAPGWPQIRDRFFEALIERSERLREELGDAAESILEEAHMPYRPSQRVFIAVTKA